jgi:threonine dehydratase
MANQISLKDYEKAYQKIKQFIIDTPIIKFDKNIFLKKESLQVTGSFKWSGVLYSVMKAFDEILIHQTTPFYLVTQSTGNHGIAVIASVTLMIKHYSKIYPEYKGIWGNISPCIFANQNIKPKKLEKMKNYLQQFKFNNRAFVDNSFNNYAHSLIARTEFLKKNNGKYMQHGGKDIMTGYGAIAFSIDRELPKGKSVSFYSAVGAGGPIGIGLCLSLLRKTKVIISQTEGFDAFILSLNSSNNAIFVNTTETVSDISDGIAVDKPEIYALQVGKKIIDKAIIVKNNDVIQIQKEIGLGGSSCIALSALGKYYADTDYIVVLDCEGNCK